jgi:hypothetical protein
MASEATTPASTSILIEAAFLRRLLPETIPPVAETGNPIVDTIIALREDMARFQKIGGDKPAFKQALREALRKELRAACMEALQREALQREANDALHSSRSPQQQQRRRPNRRRPNNDDSSVTSYPNIKPIVDYLAEREASRPKLPRAQVRRLARSVLREMQSSGEKQSSEKESSSERSGS